MNLTNLIELFSTYNSYTNSVLGWWTPRVTQHATVGRNNEPSFNLNQTKINSLSASIFLLSYMYTKLPIIKDNRNLEQEDNHCTF